MTDSELVNGCRKQDLASQKALFERYYSKVKAITLRYTHDEKEAQDILLASFRTIYENLLVAPEGIQLNDWIKKTVIPVAVRMSKDDKRTRRIVSTVKISEEDPKIQQMDEDKLIASIDQDSLIAGLRQLSPACRIAFNLAVIDEVPMREILSMLEINEGTFKLNLSQGAFQLKKNIYESVRTNYAR